MQGYIEANDMGENEEDVFQTKTRHGLGGLLFLQAAPTKFNPKMALGIA